MITISKDEISKINSLYKHRKNFPFLPNYVLEKDILVTRVILAISKISTAFVRPIFCGGTCVSKAHKAINRMSEDIDFKMMLDGEFNYSQMCRQMKKFKNALFDALKDSGFEIDGLVCKNKNRFISGSIPYQSLFPNVSSTLRPGIKADFTAINPQMPTVRHEINTITHELLGLNPHPFSIECQSLEETLIEKVTALFRRLDDDRVKIANDPYMMRHLYDISQIYIHIGGNFTPEMRRVFNQKIDQEREAFCGHSIDFAKFPRESMRNTMAKLEIDFYRNAYNEILEDMTYVHTDQPQYETVLAVFRKIGNLCIDTYEPNPEIEQRINERIRKIEADDEECEDSSPSP